MPRSCMCSNTRSHCVELGDVEDPRLGSEVERAPGAARVLGHPVQVVRGPGPHVAPVAAHVHQQHVGRVHALLGQVVHRAHDAAPLAARPQRVARAEVAPVGRVVVAARRVVEARVGEEVLRGPHARLQEHPPVAREVQVLVAVVLQQAAPAQVRAALVGARDAQRARGPVHGAPRGAGRRTRGHRHARALAKRGLPAPLARRGRVEVRAPHAARDSAAVARPTVGREVARHRDRLPRARVPKRHVETVVQKRPLTLPALGTLEVQRHLVPLPKLAADAGHVVVFPLFYAPVTTPQRAAMSGSCRQATRWPTG